MTDTLHLHPPPSPARVWFNAIRAISLTATLMPAAVVLALGKAWALHIRWPVAVSALLGLAALQIAVNLLNDVEDDRRGIDTLGSRGGAQVIQRGWLRATAVKRAALLSVAVGVLLGVPALLNDPLPIAGIGALGVLGTMGYSAQRFGLKYHALGDLSVLLLCGPLTTLGMAIAAFGAAAIAPHLVALTLAGCSFGLAAVGILHANNLQDAAEDRQAGAMTMATVLGPRWSRVYLLAVYAAAVACAAAIPWASALPGWATLAPVAVFAVPAARFVLRVVSVNDWSAPGFALMRVEAAQLHLQLGVLLLVGVLASVWF